jgi:hypothetical protein
MAEEWGKGNGSEKHLVSEPPKDLPGIPHTLSTSTLEQIVTPALGYEIIAQGLHGPCQRSFESHLNGLLPISKVPMEGSIALYKATNNCL